MHHLTRGRISKEKSAPEKTWQSGSCSQPGSSGGGTPAAVRQGAEMRLSNVSKGEAGVGVVSKSWTCKPHSEVAKMSMHNNEQFWKLEVVSR